MLRASNLVESISPRTTKELFFLLFLRNIDGTLSPVFAVHFSIQSSPMQCRKKNLSTQKSELEQRKFFMNCFLSENSVSFSFSECHSSRGCERPERRFEGEQRARKGSFYCVTASRCFIIVVDARTCVGRCCCRSRLTRSNPVSSRLAPVCLRDVIPRAGHLRDIFFHSLIPNAEERFVVLMRPQRERAPTCGKINSFVSTFA